MGSPDFGALLDSWWADGSQGNWGQWIIGNASNFVFGTNPPYSITDFFAMCPNYAGEIITTPGTLTSGSPSVTNINTNGLAVGQFVANVIVPPASSAIPAGTTIAAIPTPSSGGGSNGTITLSQNASANGSAPVTIYVGPPIAPLQVIAAYIALASSSLAQARWLESWLVAMSWFIQHFLILYARSNGNPNCGPGQVVVAGLKQGITVAASAGGVSQGLERVPGLDSWAAWNSTGPGVQLATMAKVVGAGPIYVY